MFIWNKIDNIVSIKKINSPFKSILTKLRNLYNKYINEIKNIDNKKIFENIRGIIVRTEIVVNYIYKHDWNIQKMKDANIDNIFVPYIEVMYDIDSKILLDNLKRLNKIKNFDTKKINKITNDIIVQFEKLKNKANQIFRE